VLPAGEVPVGPLPVVLERGRTLYGLSFGKIRHRVVAADGPRFGGEHGRLLGQPGNGEQQQRKGKGSEGFHGVRLLVWTKVPPQHCGNCRTGDKRVQKPGVSSGMVCKNCTRPFEGLYCYHCGQPAATRRITTREILTDTLFSVVKVNRGFLFTAKELSLRPGAAIRRYLAGQRVAYYAPHKYLFFIGAVTSFLTSRYHSFSSEYTSVDAFGGDTHSFLRAFFAYADTYATLINIVTIPVFALFSFLLFRRSGYNYAEHLVLNTYITAQQLLLFIGGSPCPGCRYGLTGCWACTWPLRWAYNLWVYVQFLRRRTAASVLRAVAAMGLAYLGQLLLNLLFFHFGGVYL
jgi:hypothetical protein